LAAVSSGIRYSLWTHIYGNDGFMDQLKGCRDQKKIKNHWYGR